MVNRFDDLFDEADKAFDGKYGAQLKELEALSKENEDSLTPNTANAEAYRKLIEVVNEASKNNLSQAELIKNVKALGEVSINLAKKVSSLATLL